MEDRLKIILERHEFLSKELLKPEVYSDFNKMKELSKEKTTLDEIVETYKKYKSVISDLETAKEMLKEKDMEQFAAEEIENLNIELDNLNQKLTILLLPKDPNDGKNVIIEIRGAAGGDEGNLFAGDLFRMYTKYAEKQQWNIELVNETPGESGGYSLVEFMLKGDNVYSKMKYESGAHRVQRVPETENQGRVHTSTATVLVMPEAEEVDIEVLDKDLKIDVYRSSGCGGQGVNTTDSAVRITHLPTNTVVTCQNERSQIKNKEKAMLILKARLYEAELRKKEESLEYDRKNKIGTGDRSEKIRTYNYPQNRLTDHRINYTVMHLDRVMEGHLDELIEALITEDQRRSLEVSK